MALVSENDVSEALEILGNETGAAARSAHEFFDALTKTVLAELMLESSESSAVAKETWAKAQPRYREHLEKVGRFAKESYAWRQRYDAAKAKIEIWRSMNANQRAMESIR
jgi:hypothetical protein